VQCTLFPVLLVRQAIILFDHVFSTQEEQPSPSHLVATGQQPLGLSLPDQPIRGRLQQVAQRDHPRAQIRQEGHREALNTSYN